MSGNCTVFNWSPDTVGSSNPLVFMSACALIIHGILWIQVLTCSALRKRNMMWLYVYLICSLGMLVRFFILYGLHQSAICISNELIVILCYFEVVSKLYINTVKSYILLAFNIYRYKQIVLNRNLYVERPYMLIAVHLLIYIIPAFNITVQFLVHWGMVRRGDSGSCDIIYSSLIIALFNVLITYVVPVSLTVVILVLGIHYVSSIEGIESEQIILLRRKRQRTLLLQATVFYSIWLILWSPDTLAYQLVMVGNDPGVYTSLLSYTQMILEPIIVAIIDVRFLTAWQSLFKRFKKTQQIAALA